MRHSLHSHIIYLENSIQDVKNRLTRESLTPDEALDLQLQLTLAETALEHYRQAYTLELTIADSEPPSNPAGNDPTGGSDSTDSSKPRKRTEGHAAIEANVRRRVVRMRRKSAIASRLLRIPQQRDI